jgi:hypothetical protein
MENLTDRRLDLFNAVKKYAENLDEQDEFILVLSYSKKMSDCISILRGNAEYAIPLIVEDNPAKDDLHPIILNAAFELCVQDPELKDKMMEGILQFMESSSINTFEKDVNDALNKRVHKNRKN